MNEITVTKINEVLLKIECDISQAHELKEFFSCYIDKHWFNPRVRAKVWDGRISFFDMKNKTLPIGLYKLLNKFAEKYSYKLNWNIQKSDMITEITMEDVQKFLDAMFEHSSYKPRDYQIESIFQAIRKKRGIIMSATGSGKSIIAYSIIRFFLGLDKKILLVVPNINLTEQMFSDFHDYGWTSCKDYVSVLYGTSNKYSSEKPVLISTWQSIFRKGQDFFDEYGAVIVDECHLSKATSIKNIMSKCVNADYRIGLTGTLQESKIDLYTIQGYLGPVLFEQVSKDLIDKGVLSKIKIANMLIRYPEDIVEKNKYRPYAEEERFITEYEDRNKIFSYIIRHLEKTDNVLVLCRLIDHLKKLEEYLHINFPNRKIYTIYGETEAEQRESTRKIVNEGNGNIIIGTYATVSTGLNLPKLHTIIFASSYKSKIKVLQSIGRGLRKHEQKDKLILFDVVDDLTWTKRTGKLGKNHLYLHFEDRLRYYKEQGFEYINKKIRIDEL